MRLLGIEKPLNEAVDQYINEVYPYQKSKPNVIVLDCDEFEARDFIALRSVYTIREETIYFKERPSPRDVCHEIEHWAQAQRAGKQKYVEELRNPLLYWQYEIGAMEVALANAPRLKW